MVRLPPDPILFHLCLSYPSNAPHPIAISLNSSLALISFFSFRDYEDANVTLLTICQFLGILFYVFTFLFFPLHFSVNNFHRPILSFTDSFLDYLESTHELVEGIFKFCHCFWGPPFPFDYFRWFGFF